MRIPLCTLHPMMTTGMLEVCNHFMKLDNY
jgi:hypothetical protein